ncbi:hypothetical protein DFJ73DRAFT_665260 [Zopfochytrium polystomum]|nr:hypothetical protein DFJ73DRAFT_665260 [Zopfochytrium polystomum]
MPLVLVTGVTGFVAAHVAKELLSRGFHVRGTVRSLAKAEHLKTVLPHPANLSFAVVKDLTDAGAFDDAVKGADYVIHCASPFHFKTQDVYRDMIDPAVKGTTSILQSVAAHAPTVKRVVVTSSMAAVFTSTPASPLGLTEEDWNDESVRSLEKDGNKADPLTAYVASKTLAERAAWDFMKAAPRSFELAVCNPPYIYGPLLQKVSSVEEVNTSCKLIADYFTVDAPKIVIPIAGGYVDVRDVAIGHVQAMTVPEAAGHRFVLSAGHHTFYQVLDILRAAYPDRSFPVDGPPSSPWPNEVSAKAEKVLGITFRSLDTTVRDTAASLVESLKL